MPRRILVLNERDPTHPLAGGAETHIYEIFSRLPARGHEITHLAASYKGARREEVVQGETGILVGVNQPNELAQALDALVGNRAARKKLGSAGRVRALDLYDEDKVVARQIKTLAL